MSRTPIDITGQRFGRLVAIRDVGSLRSFRLWEFQCDCGSVVTKTSTSVRTGSCRSCGCLQRSLSSTRHTRDRTGERVGRLLVIERADVSAHGHVRWRCRCDCGNERVIDGIALTKGTRSCGCLQREVAAEAQRKKALPPDVKAASRKASAAKQRARRKSDPLAVMQSRLSRLHRHALRQVGGIKSSPTFEHLGYTVEQFVRHIERQFAPGMGWHNMDQWQIDHILPIAGATSVEDVLALNQLSNLRPMWALDNNRKKDRRVVLV